MTQTHFFATRADILAVLEEVERSRPLKYILTGNQTNPNFDTYRSAAYIADLGAARGTSTINCRAFLITHADLPVTVRTINAIGGAKRYLMDQLLNGDTLFFAPGGMYEREVLIAGRIGTASSSPISKQLMKLCRAEISRQFTKVKGYRLGPGARALFDRGTRLTQDIQSPPEFDLQKPPP